MEKEEARKALEFLTQGTLRTQHDALYHKSHPCTRMNGGVNNTIKKLNAPPSTKRYFRVVSRIKCHNIARETAASCSP